MTLAPEKPRSAVELAAIARSLALTRGSAPDWLRAEMSVRTPARCAKPSPGDYRGHMAAALSMGGLLAAFLACVDLIGEVRYDAPRPAVPRFVEAESDGLEAIAMVQDWRPAGDEKPVLSRLAAVVRNPAYPRAWSAEKTEADSYLVIFREPAGTPAYAFEVNLEAGEVLPTPEAVERLTMLRVREETESATDLVAHTR